MSQLRTLMDKAPTKKEIQHQLGSLAKLLDGVDRFGHWVNDDLLENDPRRWRAKRLQLELLLLRQEVAKVDAEIQRREEGNDSPT